MVSQHIAKKMLQSVKAHFVLLFITMTVLLPSLQGGDGGRLLAQEVTVMVSPVQQVLPPQAGQYVDNPGRFFTIQLFNNTDEQQLVHLGLQIEQRFPDKVLWVSTNVEKLHIPRQPIVLQPNQHKALNSIEMRHLFDHFDLNDIYIRDGRHLSITDNDFGLMPEGEYEAFVTAYKWDPELTVPVPVSAPNSGNTIFNICYEAEAPKFLSPAPTDADGGFGELQIVKVDKNNPTFTWIAPTLNCNASAVQFEHSIRIVELGSLQPDEAMSSMGVPVFLEKKHITGNTYRIDPAYVLQMIESGKHKGKVFAMQITASTPYFANNSINFSLLKNEGKSPIMLFQLIDPAVDDDYQLELDSTDVDADKEDSLYIFEQPMLTSPTFSGMMGRKIYYGEDVKAEWRKAWFAGGKGEEQDTVQFKYTLALYTGNSADTREAIFASKPIIKKETKELKDTIKWDELKDKITLGDYFYLRVTAEATNEKSIRMLPDSLNFIDFALSTHFDETYHCGQSTANVSNKTLISKKPDKNTKLTIGAWTLTFDDQYDQVEFDKDKKTLKGTGWINWSPGSMSLRIAVKFDALKVNTDNVVFDGTCKTYPKSENKLAGLDYTSEQFVDSLFSSASLDDIFGNMALPEGVQDKINNFVEKDAKGEAYNLAKGYNLGKYYSAYKKAENVWNNWQQGNLMDVYFPAEIPEDIKKHLPKDFNVQIANMSFSPSAAVMNVIGEIALPNSDIFEDQDVLVFGAPRLCVQPDRFFPEDGVLALLSNFAIKDPSSDFRLIFKAPSNPLDPDSGDGCFIRWENDEFDALGMQIAMSIPNTKRFIDGKVNDDIPALADLSATIYAGESACDFLATGTLTPFEVVDLPGWTFGPEKDKNEMRIIFDHHLSRNGDGMPTLDEVKKLFPSNTFNEDLCGTYVKNDWDAWQGLYVSSLAVGFPKFAVFGNGEEGLSVGTRNMLIDASGVTCQVFADNILDAETGSLGGWKFTIADATVDIIQNNFDNCVLHGGFGVPLLGKAADDKADAESKSKGGPSKNADDKKSGGKTGTGGKDDKSDKQENDFTYTCQIRHLTKPGEVKYQAWSSDGKTKVTKTRKEYTDDRLAYLFTTELVGDLSLNFFLADLKLHDKQTFLLVESVDKEDGSGQDTQVELCLAGDITLAGTDNINTRLAKVAEKIGNEKLPLRLPGIHFAKMRLSNRKLSEWKDFGIDPKNTHKEGIKAQEDKITEWKKSALYVPLAGGEELELSKECYFNYGEWSLASERKKIGPFSFNLTSFKPSLSGDKLGLAIAGGIGLVDDKICVDAGITITSTLHKQGSVSEWYLSDGDVEFDSLSLDLDFTAIHMKGTLKIGDDGKGSKGYAGELDMDITGLFGLKCKGGYFKYTATEDDKTKMRENAKTLAEAAVEQAKKSGKGSTDYNYYYDRYVDNDTIYSWGYFMASLSSQMLRIDPVVITRIAGGFYFNCRPTPGGSGGSGDPKKAIDKFSGDPKPYYGMIGVAFGLGMAASSGESTLKADLDLLVVYDRKNSCLSTFMFNGDCEAVGGIIKADVSLIYENAKDLSGQTTDRYLCLNITAEGSFAKNELGDMVKKANEKLEAAKAELDKFQNEVQGVANELLSEAPKQGLGELSNIEEGDKKKELTAEEKAKKEAEDKEKQEELGTSGTFNVPLELKITWVKNSETYSTPKWHLYVGQPAKDKRCRFILLDFKSNICSAELGADAYLCLGNELPDGGALPEIPSKITEFLSGHKNAGTDMGADMTKVNNSRKNAVRKLLDPNSCEGGVMVGASAWGGIELDLGLIYGNLEAIAGFDAALVHYGNTAICMNTFSEMGKNGWYAMGQLYAYLGASLGVRIKIGSLINEEVELIKAGIGGLLEIGLPNPTWVEGQARVKMSFLGGLFSINKKFSFSAGDRCIPFQGNALDGFELFQGVSLGSDSLYEAWYKPEFAISASDASRMTFTTNSSIGSHYRLVDPSYLPDVVESAGTGEADSLFNIYASRTYVFDMDQNTNLNDMKMGVRLFDLGDINTQLMLYSQEMYNNHSFEPEDFYKALGAISWDDVIKPQGRSGQLQVGEGLYGMFMQYLASNCQKRENTVCETSWAMWGRDLTYTRKGNAPLHRSETASFDEVIASNNLYKNSSFGYRALKNPYLNEVNVSFRESKGNFFHLSNMDLKPGHCYVLVLMADAYEIDNGKRVWCQYVNTDGGKAEPEYIKWRQSKLWFFRTKTEREEAIQLDSVRTLTPYVALAYPSVDGTRVQSGGEGYTTAYINDIMHPTIALNRHLFNDDTKQRLQWVLTAYKADEFNTKNPDAGWHQTQTRDVKIIDADNCVNLEPATAFNRISEFTNAASKAGYDFSNELYHLQLTYTYKLDSKNDSTRAIVDLWLTAAPHDVTVKGITGKQDDSWLQATNSAITGEILPYSLPFVGVRPEAAPTFAYESSFENENGEELLTDEQLVFENAKYGKTPFRLIDPYLYLSYLSKWTFIGDRAIGQYSFDDAYIPFASESLIFERNGTVVNSDFIKGEEGRSLWTLRNDMYNTWNNWYYNNPEGNVEWPLPSLAKTAGGPTVANQDRKTSTITPVNLNHSQNSFGNYINLIEDYAAAYEVANELCTKLKYETMNLFTYFIRGWDFTQGRTYDFNSYDDSSESSKFDFMWNYFKLATFNDDRFNDYMKSYNRLHRGQYLEVKKGDVMVRVPYYQLPLIFGGCFGSSGWPSASYQDHSLNYSRRGFASSIGAKEMKANVKDGEYRWIPYASNLLFFRLLGSEPIPNFNTVLPLKPLAFNRFSGQYANSYPNPWNSDNQYVVDRDVFDVKESLSKVTGFKASSYRVDSYDLTTGEYRMLNRGGGPWKNEMQIGSGGVYKNLADAYDASATIRSTEQNNFDKPVTQALMSRTSDGMVLKLVYSTKIYKANQYYDGKYITAVSSGDDFMSAENKSKGHYADATKVIIDKSFADARVKSTASWFRGFNNLTTIEGISNLNTSAVTDMSEMFAGNFSLQSLDLTSFDTQNVTNTGYMFSFCEKLETLKLGFSLPKVTNMENMFYRCGSLKTIDMADVGGYDVTNTYGMFEGCKSLTTLHIDNFSPNNVRRYANMFVDVPSNITIHYAYDLDKRIRDQFPSGAKLVVGSNPYKAVYVQTVDRTHQLMFVRNSTDFRKSQNYNITANGVTYRNATVKDVWTAEQVTNTGDKPGWADVASKIEKVIIDKSFIASPQTTKQWFAGFTSLTEIQGLENLNTEEVKNMNKMFLNCEKVQELNVKDLQTKNVEDMSEMFRGCKALKSIDVSRFNHSKVKTMSSMFRDCENLASIELFNNLYEGMTDRNFDLIEMPIEDMSYMFYNCKSLKQLKIGATFDSRRATTMRTMFGGCTQLERIDNSSGYFRTDNAEILEYMFSRCSSLKELNLSQFNMGKAKRTAYMFSECSSLQKLILDHMTLESIVDNNKMFNAVPTDCYIEMLASTYEGTTNMKTMLPKSVYVNLKLVYPVWVLKVEDGNSKKLVFLASNSTYNDGGMWNGHKIVGVYSGMRALENHNWTRKDGTEISSVVFDPSFAQVSPTNTTYWFNGLTNLTKVEGLQYLNTSEVTSMYGMFEGCSKLESLPYLNTLNTGKVKNMTNMFRLCQKLSAADVSNFNTAAVESMNHMFSFCQNLTVLNVSKWNVSNVRDMEGMFSGCYRLTTLGLANWNPVNVTTMKEMFLECRLLTEFDFSGWETKDLQDVSGLFWNCKSLRSLKFGNGLNLSQLKGKQEKAFLGVRDVAVELPITKQSVLREQFVSKLGFIEGDTGWFVMSNDEKKEAPENVAQAILTGRRLNFYYGPLRKEGGTYGGNTVTKVWSGSVVTDKQYSSDAWRNKTDGIASQVLTVEIDKSFANVKLTSMDNWFRGFSSLTEINGLENINTSSLESISSLFEDCPSLQTIDLSKFNPQNLKGMAMGSLFKGCSSLKEIDLSHLKTGEVTSMSNLFSGCSSLVKVNLSGWNTAKVTAMNGMFADCSSLKELDLSSFDTNVESSTTSMFKNCTQLEMLIVGSNFTFNKLTRTNSKVFTGANFIYVMVKPTSALSTVKDAFINKLGFVDGTTGRILTSDIKCAQAVWTKENGTMTFLYGYQYKSGDKYKGATITNVWTSNANPSNASKWRAEVKDYLTKVVIDDSYVNVSVHNTSGWFMDCTKLTSIQGLKNLHTNNTSSMFRNTGFVEINISELDTKMVKMMNAMFLNCTSLKTAICNVNTENLTSMYQMFRNCSSLKDVILSSFKTWNVTDMGQLFYGCTSLSHIYLGDSFSTLNVTNYSNCFTNVEPENLEIRWRGNNFYKSATDYVVDNLWTIREEQLKKLGLSGCSETTDSRTNVNYY